MPCSASFLVTSLTGFIVAIRYLIVAEVEHLRETPDQVPRTKHDDDSVFLKSQARGTQPSTYFPGSFV